MQHEHISKQGFTCPRRSKCRDYGSMYPVQRRFPAGLIPAFAVLAVVSAIVIFSFAMLPKAIDQQMQHNREVVAKTIGR